MAAYVASLSATMDDQVSAGGDAATKTLERLADASDKATASLDTTQKTVTRAGQSATALVNSLDPATKAANNLAAAQSALAAKSVTLAAGLDAGTISQAQMNAAMDTLATKVRIAQTALDQIGSSAGTAATQISGITDTASEMSNALAAAQKYQDALNTSLGISARTPDGYEQRALDIAAYGAALDGVRAKFDPVFAVSKQYEATLDEISIAEKNGALSANVASAARANATATFQANVDSANRSAAAIVGATEAHAGFYREIVILGHEVITGNYSRIPGSLVVLAERSGSLETIFEKVVAAVTSLPGILTLAGVAGAAAFTYMAISSDNAVNRLLELQDHLRATRDDYVSMGAEAQGAAQDATRRVPGLSLADADTASGVLSASPQFAGTRGQLSDLTVTAAEMAKVFNETVDKAATDLAQALVAPGDAADKLVGKLRGMSQALADSIKLQADAGDRAGAFARVLDVETQASQGAAKELSPLRDALRDIETAFNDSGTAGSTSGQGIASAFRDAAYWIMESVAAVLGAIKTVHDVTGQMLPWAAGYGSPTTAAGEWAATGQSSVYNGINTTGAQLGLTADQIDFAHRVSIAESGGVQADAFGNVTTSAAGALGAMQVLPGTAAQYGQDPNTLAGNLSAGEQQVKHLWDKYGGDQTLVAAAYNWGEGNLDKWIQAGSNQAALPPETQKYVTKVTGLPTVTTPTGLTGNAAGVADSGAATIDQALQKANGSLGANQQSVQATIDLYRKAESEMALTGQVGSDAWKKVDTALQAAYASQSNLQDPLDKALVTIGNQTRANDDLTTAYAKDYDAVADATAGTKAYDEALTTVGKNSPSFHDAVIQLTDAYHELAESANEAGISQSTLSNKDQLAYIQAETTSLGQNDDVRNTMLAHMKAEQDLRQKGISDQTALGKAYLGSVDDISAATAAYTKQQAALSELDSFAQSTFTTIGNAITTAFTQGGGSAINFGSIVKGVMSSVLQEVVKLAAINPLLNSLLGGSRPTLDSVSGLLGGSSGASSLGGIGGLYSSLFGGGTQAADGVVNLPGVNLNTGLADAGSVSLAPTASLGSQVGGALGSVGIGIGVSSLLGSLDGKTSQNNQIAGAVGSAAGAAIGSIIPGIGTTIGAVVGGLIGGLFGNSKPSDMTMKAQQNLVTSTVTNVGESSGKEASPQNLSAATNLANVTYSAATALASAFGLSLPSRDVDAAVGTRDGDTLQIGGEAKYTAANSQAGAASLVNQAIGGLVNTIGGTLDATTKTILTHIDYSSSSASQQVSTLAASLTNGKLDATQTAALPKINTANAASAIDDLSWIKNSYEAAINNSTSMGSIATQTTAVNTAFAALITRATQLGLSTTALTSAQAQQIADIKSAAQAQVATSGASILAAYQKLNGDALAAQQTAATQSAAQQQASLTALFKGLYGSTYATQSDYVTQVQQLTAVLAQQTNDIATQWQSTNDSTGAGWISNITAGWKAQASVAATSSSPGQVAWARNLNQAADLANFDAQAKTTQDSYTAQLVSTYGAGYTKSATYAQQMVDLENSLASQRLAIISTYAQQAKAAQSTAEQSAGSVISGLVQYAASLATGSSSPLNAQNQYALAQKQYQADLVAAQAGNTTALGALQADSSTYLGASQNLNGSGAGYVADFDSVVAALGQVANTAQDALTQEFMTAALQSQTDVLGGYMTDLRTELQLIRAELQQTNARPA